MSINHGEEVVFEDQQGPEVMKINAKIGDFEEMKDNLQKDMNKAKDEAKLCKSAGKT